ncbi:MAG: ion transporter [Gammaproteobacteria bacterium]|nr:ion transporter [Gammaproteobacteria bacterium]
MDRGEPSPRLFESRQRMAYWIEAARVQYFIVAIIVINAVTLGLETSPAVMVRVGYWLLVLDNIVLGVFVLEMSAKLYAYRWGFFRDPWNVFDFVIVSIALIPASGPLSVMRVLRILRVMRLISVMPRLRFVVESLLHAIPGIASIAGLLVLLFYVFAVMATGLYGTEYSAWFGTIGKSMYTLFQIMTLESWSMGIVRPVMESHPYAWLFFIPFILIATFTILNLFIAIIVNTMQTMHDRTQEQERSVIEGAVQTEQVALEEKLEALHEELRELKRLLVNGHLN